MIDDPREIASRKQLGNCLACRHSHMFEQEGAMAHWCTRFPPSTVAQPSRDLRGIEYHSVYPPVDARSRICGEYAPEIASNDERRG